MNSDHKEIWLEPEPPMDDDEVGRTWCQDNVYDPYDYDGNKPTRYIRADIAESRIKKLQSQVDELNITVEVAESFIDEEDRVYYTTDLKAAIKGEDKT